LTGLAIEGPRLDHDLDRQNVVVNDIQGRFIIEFNLEKSLAFIAL